MTTPHPNPFRALDAGSLWSFLRSVLEQGRAIQMDNAAGKYETYEHLSARIDEAARERADELSRAIESADAAPSTAAGWRPIETAPKDGSYVLVVNCHARPDYRVVYIASYRIRADGEPGDSGKEWRDYSGRYSSVTHWQTLPEPPQVQP